MNVLHLERVAILRAAAKIASETLGTPVEIYYNEDYDARPLPYIRSGNYKTLANKPIKVTFESSGYVCRIFARPTVNSNDELTGKIRYARHMPSRHRWQGTRKGIPASSSAIAKAVAATIKSRIIEGKKKEIKRKFKQKMSAQADALTKISKLVNVHHRSYHKDGMSDAFNICIDNVSAETASNIAEFAKTLED